MDGWTWEKVHPKVGLQGQWRRGGGKHGRQGLSDCWPSPTAVGLTCSTSKWTIKRKVPIFLGGGRTELSAQEGGNIQQSPPLVAPPNWRKKTSIWGAVFSADLQVAAWPSCQRPTQFVDTLNATGLRIVLRAFSAQGMINGAARSLHPEGNWACNILEAAERLPKRLIRGTETFWTLYPFRDLLEVFLLCPEYNLWQNVLKERKKDHTTTSKIWETEQS